jgi:hypothetical protein
MPLGPLGEIVSAGRTRILWDSGATGAGAAIDSPLLDCRFIRSIGVYVDNSGGATTQVLSLDSFTEADMVNAYDLGFALRTVAATSKERGIVGPDNASTAGTPAIQFAFPIPIPPYVKLHLATAAYTRRIVVTASP